MGEVWSSDMSSRTTVVTSTDAEEKNGAGLPLHPSIHPPTTHAHTHTQCRENQGRTICSGTRCSRPCPRTMPAPSRDERCARCRPLVWAVALRGCWEACISDAVTAEPDTASDTCDRVMACKSWRVPRHASRTRAVSSEGRKHRCHGAWLRRHQGRGCAWTRRRVRAGTLPQSLPTTAWRLRRSRVREKMASCGNALASAL